MAHALRISTRVETDTLTLRDLGDFIGKQVEIIVLEEERAPDEARAKSRRPLGLYRGRVTLKGDLDEPLPAEIQGYFDGDGHTP